MQIARLFAILFLSFFWSATVSAQVFDSGPSDRSLFTRIFDLPGDDLPGSDGFITVGGVDGETTQVNVTDGASIDGFFAADSGAEVNISGGTVSITGSNTSETASAFNGAEVNISGGAVGKNFQVFSGSEVNISGGSVGSNTNLSSLEEFAIFVDESVLNVSGGEVGVNNTGNSDGIEGVNGSVVNISGGVIGAVSVRDSVANISDGIINRGFSGAGGEINVSGGLFEIFSLNPDGAGNISGGSFAAFDARDDSFVNLIGSEFLLNGVSLDDDLNPGEAFTILDRDVTLSGLLTDGSEFSFDLNPDRFQSGDFFSSTSTLTVTLATAIPEPTSFAILLFGCGLAGIRRKRRLTATN